MPLPNLIIGGAPKCGTTSLYRWLGDHPAVHAPINKETFYLADRGTPFWNPRHNYQLHRLDGYRRLFDDCPPGARWVLEGTTHYLYHRTAREVLSQIDPRPQVIFVLRQPARRIYSSFKFTQNSRGDLDPDVGFDRYVDCLLAGRIDRLRDRFYTDRAYSAALHDLSYSRYVDHLQLWRERFGERGLHLLTFEQLVADPARVVGRLAGDLGLDRDFYTGYSFGRENATFGLRSHALHRWVRRLAELVPRNRWTVAVYQVYLRCQKRRRDTMTDGDRSALARLDEYLEPHSRRLADAFGMELSAWAA